MSNDGNNSSSNNNNNNNNNNNEDDDSERPRLLLPGETGHRFINYDKLNPPADWNPTPAMIREREERRRMEYQLEERRRLECKLEIQCRQLCCVPKLPPPFFIIEEKEEKEEINRLKRACEEH